MTHDGRRRERSVVPELVAVSVDAGSGQHVHGGRRGTRMSEGVFRTEPKPGSSLGEGAIGGECGRK